ncbi:MAG TPA: hypothetical protein VJZ71_18205 [Phycisphaerae bacterium]|nr:hypothetical protein [Phycisphaerae bacterium]
MRSSGRQLAVLLACASFGLASPKVRATGAASQIVNDPASDAVIRLTDDDADGPCDPETQGMPDLAQMRLGRFAPSAPSDDLFSGDWSYNGEFLRFDMVFSGVVNPPGPLGFDWDYPEYAPFKYGPNPVFGWIELDVDVDVTTGGELAHPEFRYLGNVARFGGRPQGSQFTDRMAENQSAFDQNVLTAPYVDRCGEEFHLAFVAEDINAITILEERPGGEPAIFEDGETWLVEGRLFHRAHGFEEFAFMCPYAEGEYMPTVQLRFCHNAQTDRTTISLVYPLTNAACAAIEGPSTPVEEIDGCTDNQHSMEEALSDLKFSATYATYLDRLNPEFQLLAEWEFKSVANHLSPAAWRIQVLVGTAYGAPQPDNAYFVWTDVWPNPRLGDFDGNGTVDGLDSASFYDYLGTHDGLPGTDDDLDPFNGRITLSSFASNFSLFDTNHDGLVHPADLSIRGDMDLDGDLDFWDVDDFAQALIDPVAYQEDHEGADPEARGDMNADFRLDGADIAVFTDTLLDPGGVRSPNPFP